MAEEEVEYESDPEEAKLSLKMRRREASDDEEEEGGEVREKPPRRVDDSDGESEGAAAEYDDEFEEEEGDEDYYIEEEIDGVNAVPVESAEAGEDGGVTGEFVEETVNNYVSEFGGENNDVEDRKHEGEKKEMEPYAVPTAGAFYMHDDRFRGNAAGRHRRTLGGRRLWESKDDRRWGHDKFEELTMPERNYKERKRGSRGFNRGRAMNRTSDHGFSRQNRTREQADYGIRDNSNQNNAPKSVRGRGPRRYQPSLKNKEPRFTENKQSWKQVEKPSYVSSVGTSQSTSNPEHVVWPRKQVFASNLSIASPPFYPSGSAIKDNNVPSKRDVQDGSINQNGQPSVVGKHLTMERSSWVLQEKTIVDSVGVDKLYIDDSLSALAGKPANTKQLPVSGPTSINSSQQQLRGQGRGIASLTQMAYRPAVSNSQVNKGNPSNQIQTVQSIPGHSRAQSFLEVSGWQFVQRLPSGLKAASPPEATVAVTAVESEELEAPAELKKSKTALVPTGKGSRLGRGRGSFIYGGAQVSGTSGNTSHGDQDFPAFLPVMQLGGQHPGRMGVPAVGMAFPGYVAQPQLGLGNSEMTWLPVLAGATGALEARYCPPYISVDGSYRERPSGQMPSTTETNTSSKERDADNVSTDWRPVQRPDPPNDESGQRQKNPRRYTEMKFDQ